MRDFLLLHFTRRESQLQQYLNSNKHTQILPDAVEFKRPVSKSFILNPHYVCWPLHPVFRLKTVFVTPIIQECASTHLPDKLSIPRLAQRNSHPGTSSACRHRSGLNSVYRTPCRTHPKLYPGCVSWDCLKMTNRLTD